MSMWVLLVIAIVGFNLWRYWRTYRSFPTFEEYRSQYPHLVRGGHVRCCRCGGGRVHVHHMDPDHRRHICASCSAVLYRS